MTSLHFVVGGDAISALFAGAQKFLNQFHAVDRTPGVSTILSGDLLGYRDGQ
jgi:hypothetical protein